MHDSGTTRTRRGERERQRDQEGKVTRRGTESKVSMHTVRGKETARSSHTLRIVVAFLHLHNTDSYSAGIVNGVFHSFLVREREREGEQFLELEKPSAAN